MAEHRQLCPKLLSLLKVWLKLGGEEKERIEEAPSGDRTHDRTLTKRMLYQLSYRGNVKHAYPNGIQSIIPSSRMS